jgi:preprotein translocase subunit SecF
MEFFKKTPTVPFMAKRRWCYAVSVVLILGSVALLATRGLNWGIDFTGGVVVELSYPAAANVESTRTTIAQAGYPDAVVTLFGTDRELLIRTIPGKGEDANKVSERILQAVKAENPGVELRRTEAVGSQVGEELFEQGGLALLVTFMLILFYVGFRFEKKMGAGTVFAALHDPIVIVGFFSLTQMTFDLSVLAAVLAVIGYSINDTVVVFDRVREVFHTMRKATPAEVIDAAVNQTLSRTLMTSFSTLFVVVSLYLFGGEALKGFSAAIIVGVIVGTFSSIFVAGALALDMKLNIHDLLPVHKDDAELDAMP